VNRIKALLLCATSLALSPAAALAADAAAPAAAGGQGPMLEEIVVTAQKREQNLQSVPLSVTAVSAATLKQAGVVDMRGIANIVPSLSVVQTIGPVNQSYRIRGMGSDANIPTFEPDVALFVDGVYMPRSGLSVDDLVEIQRVEVLEGPQSTLYGKNATAGVINVVTTPPAKQLEGSIEGSYSNLDSSLQAPVFRVAGTVSGPITDNVRFRLTGVSYNQGDSYKNLVRGVPDANNLHRYALRGELAADLSPDTDLRLVFAHSQLYNTRSNDADNLYYTFPPNANNAFRLITALGPRFGLSVCPDNDPNNRIICTTSPWRNSAHNNVASATLTKHFSAGTLTSITAYNDYWVRDTNGDIAQVQLPVLAYDDTQKGRNFSQEIRFISPTGEKLEWLAGSYYEHAEFNRGDDGKTPTFVIGPAGPFVPLPAPLASFRVGQPGDLGFLNSELRSNYGALFGQVSYHFNDHFTLTGGLRGQIEAKHATQDNSFLISPATPRIPLGPCGTFPVNLITVSLSPVALPRCPLVPVNADFSHQTSYLTWNVTGEYHLDRDTMFYVRVARGAKSFGYNLGFGNAPASVRPFKDEFVMDYELGVKTTQLDGRARLSAALFRSDEKNYQNAGFIGLQFLVNNAEKVIVQGFEANGDLAITRDITANAGVTYVDAKYDQYTGGSCFFGRAPDNGAGGCNLSGEGLPLTPHWRTNMGVQYKHPVPVGELYSRVDWTWQSSMLANTNLDPRSRQPAYSLVNLRLGMKADNGLDVSLWANNVSDTTYTQADYVSNLFGANDPAFQRYLGRPREYGVTLRKSF
jgi:outer membrane receptor protein involved in Fe transport